jgi:hypothetical protein
MGNIKKIQAYERRRWMRSDPRSNPRNHQIRIYQNKSTSNKQDKACGYGIDETTGRNIIFVKENCGQLLGEIDLNRDRSKWGNFPSGTRQTVLNQTNRSS